MTDRYTHINLHDERAVIEDLPDYSIEKQRAVKTGTDDTFLRNSCFQGAFMRTTVEKKTLVTFKKRSQAIITTVPDRLPV
jgi:hypothetical protein